jgi:hypothetical protein
MSRQFRLRATGVALAALFVVGPLVVNGTASADLVESANDLVFSGSGRNMLGLSCVAEPRKDSVRVEAGSTLRVVNDTGHDADLRLDGVSKGALPDSSATEVLFRRGPVEVTLLPNCMMAAPSEPVRVTVAPAPTTTNPVPIPTIDQPSSEPVGTPSHTSVPPVVKPPGKPVKTTRPGTPVKPGKPAVTPPRRPNAANTTGTTANGQTGPQAATTRARIRTTAAPDPAPTTAPAAITTDDPAAGTPDDASSGPVLAAPDGDLTSTAPAAAAAEPVAKLEPMSGTSAVSLLALAATVCLAGVACAAIRAIVAQRAYRTSMA